jgi:peptide/nickel transport system permease protein
VLGTDELGRDVLSRLIYGARISLMAGGVSIALAVALGTPLGLLAGYHRGWVDALLGKVIDAFLSFPALVLALGIAAALGPSLTNIMIALGVVYMPRFARLVRGQTLSLRQEEFVTAARAVGVGDGRILIKHIFPSVTSPIIVQASLSCGFAIVAEASLSFLGLGGELSVPSWGSMLRTGYGYMEIAPLLAVSPGLMIFLAVLSFNLLGDGLRDALDPRLNRFEARD